MQYTTLGTTDLKVSRIALGCMGFADPAQGVNPWALDEEAAAPMFRRAVELGITLWDTANVYGGGTSEEIVGRALKTYTRREDVVLATKVGLPMHSGPGGAGLSRRAILTQVDASLTRLGTDYIDLYQIHRFDPATPVEETMAALHEVVAAGKVRHLGASSMWAWQFAKMQHTAARNGHTPFVSMQNQYSLVQREDEREMFPLLADQGVASLPWCPLAKGRLARPRGQVTTRSAGDPMGQRFFGDVDRPIVEAVERIAAARGIPMARTALAWVLNNPVVAAPIVGATRPTHLDDAAAALDVHLDTAELEALEGPYTPREPTGF
ncbi:alcohol dehydrogenase [Streptomyces sp. NRRL F-4489]|uniref:aldo/keto reductase n=1 Tax=Streptomyces sp. NRRL F-4489 TaxID=1609095 RepID=UPI00074855D6|nr:aldo/keto reductase [Streptomyces sp. NRRL F-4489]KUL38895.1 alcohol dehydrogenase [Streptomyces sp. NRRL F-4489]